MALDFGFGEVEAVADAGAAYAEHPCDAAFRRSSSGEVGGLELERREAGLRDFVVGRVVPFDPPRIQPVSLRCGLGTVLVMADSEVQGLAVDGDAAGLPAFTIVVRVASTLPGFNGLTALGRFRDAEGVAAALVQLAGEVLHSTDGDLGVPAEASFVVVRSPPGAASSRIF